MSCFRAYPLLVILPLTFLITSFQSKPLPDINQALVGSYIGTLTYKDYSDNSLVRLPTLLCISRNKESGGLTFRYVYDDGPNKVVQDKDFVAVDLKGATYTVESADDKSKTIYVIEGADRLKTDGTGKILLLGKGTENKADVEIRQTLTIGKEKLSLLRETKLAGGAYKFRHEYSFLRVVQPKPGSIAN